MKNRFLMTFAALLTLASSCTEEQIGNPGQMLANSDGVVADHYTTATFSGTVYGDGIVERGFVWALAATTDFPTLENSSIADNGAGAGSFTMNVSGLTAGTAYRVRTYAKDADGYASYGSARSFSTVPNLAVAVASSSADLRFIDVNGSITGGLANLTVTERGIYWSTSSTPQTDGTKIQATTAGKGNFSVRITGLEPDTQYYVVSYAISSEGTIYSPVTEIKTKTLNTELWGSAINTAGLTVGYVHGSDGNFAMRYSYNIVQDMNECTVDITYIENGDGDVKHERRNITFNDDLTQATWAAVSNGSVSWTGMRRNGTTFSTVEDDLALVKPLPASEIMKMYIKSDEGGYGRVSESRTYHSTVGQMWNGDNRVQLIEINGGYNALMTQWVWPGGAEWMCVEWIAGTPPVVSGDKVTLARGNYFWDGGDDSRRTQFSETCSPFLDGLLFNTAGSYIIPERALTDTVEQGGFNYYQMSADGTYWYKWFFRVYGT